MAIHPLDTARLTPSWASSRARSRLKVSACRTTIVHSSYPAGALADLAESLDVGLVALNSHTRTGVATRRARKRHDGRRWHGAMPCAGREDTLIGHGPVSDSGSLTGPSPLQARAGRRDHGGMRATFRLGKVAGVPIGARWSTLFVLALFTTLLATTELPAAAPGYPTAAYWVGALLLAGLFLASLLAHELRMPQWPATTASRSTASPCGCSVASPGSTNTPSTRHRAASRPSRTSDELRHRRDVRSTLPPPSVCWEALRLLVGALSWLAMVSVMLTLFNLLPGAPLAEVGCSPPCSGVAPATNEPPADAQLESDRFSVRS